VDQEGVYQGIVDIDQINESIRTMRSDAVTRAREGLASDRGDGKVGSVSE